MTRLARAALLLAPIFLMAALAGCVDDPAPDLPADAAGPADEPLTPLPNVTMVSSQYTFDIRDAGLSSFIGQNKLLLLDLDANVTGLVAELRWDDPLDDLDLYVYSPAMCADSPMTGQGAERMACSWLDWWTYGGQAGSHVTGLESGPGTTTYLRLEIGEDILGAEQCAEPPCRWRVVVGSEVVVDSRFDMAATVFAGAPIPEGFSAFADQR